MPCQHDGYEDERYSLNDTISKLVKDVDNLTQGLCFACKYIEANNGSVPKELESWWKKHKEFDAKRKLEEKKKLLEMQKQAIRKKQEAMLEIEDAQRLIEELERE